MGKNKPGEPGTFFRKAMRGESAIVARRLIRGGFLSAIVEFPLVFFEPVGYKPICSRAEIQQRFAVTGRNP